MEKKNTTNTSRFTPVMIKTELKDLMTQQIAKMTLENPNSKKMSYSDLINDLIDFYQKNKQTDNK